MAGRIIGYLIIGFIVGAVFFVKGLLWWRQKRLIENIPTSKIRSIAMGLVEIFGTVISSKSKVLKSPFTDKDCVYYKYTIEELRRSKNSSYWAKIAGGEEGNHFFLEDDTGKVLVDPKGAKVEIPKDYEFRTGWGKDLPPIIKTFLEKQSIRHKGLFGIFNRTLRFREYYIAPKDKLYIMGTAGDNPFKKEATAMHSTEDIMIKKGEYEKTYYISDSPETKILKSLRTRSLLGIIGGGILLIGCLALLVLSITYWSLFYI